MIEEIVITVDKFGNGFVNALLFFLLALFTGFYFYFKTFYRLTYSVSRICKNCNTNTEWKSNESEFTTRVLFYNNGRKTLTMKEVNKLQLNSLNKIKSVKILKGAEEVRLQESAEGFDIFINYLDTSEFLVFEVAHIGKLNVVGRISETGKLLNTEPKCWLTINIIYLILLFVVFIGIFIRSYLVLKNTGDFLLFELIVSMIILFGIGGLLRVVHRLFFIPDKVHSQYLDTKDKFRTKFKNSHVTRE